MRGIILLCILACLSRPTAAFAVEGNLPDTVLPNGMHVGSWSASNPNAGAQAAAPAKPAAADPAPDSSANAAPDHLPDTVLPNGMHIGSWSASNPNAGNATAPASSGNADMQGHTMTVTSLQNCYDQLTPAEVAEVKLNYLKPYAECLARVQAKKEAKQELKQGETRKALTPEGPRNYIRVQAPEAPTPAADPANSPKKSDTKLNP
jgi:hypothetical protein